jgi:hypothetical protein
VTELLYELERLKSPHAQAKYKRFIPLLQRAVETLDHYEEENKSLRAQLAPKFVCPICNTKPEMTVWHDQYCTYKPTHTEGCEHTF